MSTSINVANPNENTLLHIGGVSKRFGGLQALQDVSLRIQRGQIYGLIGPNGAGKTTLFNLITGLYTADSGTFALDGKPYSPKAVDAVVRAGIARTFQNIRLFADMTVLENVLVGRHTRFGSSLGAGLWGAMANTKSFRAEEAANAQLANDLLAYVGIAPLAQQRAKNLSYGDQRRLEIARALATEPQLLALDEPAAGMNPAEKMALRDLIERIRSERCSVLLIEHDVKLVMGLCDEVSVLEYGRLIAQGTPAQVQSDPRVIEAYLGQSAKANPQNTTQVAA